ncbi:MAG: polysaccharide biosynthesis C-terminal domain-containing protein [Bacteroidetes bacterium]|nr:polysaccharide biosynthesis C-terminal domain-containing protein [Bacteroidota bacterium]
MGVVQRQGIKNTISSYVGILLGFISLIIIQPHFLRPEEIGLARVLFAFSTLISTFIPIGVTNIAMKYFPVFKDEKSGHHGFLGFMLLYLVVGFLIAAGGLLIFREFIISQYRRESPLITDFYYYIIPFSFFLGLVAVLNSYLIALFKSSATSYFNDVFVRLGYIALIFLYYFKILTLQQFIGGYIVIYILQFFLLVIYMKSVDRPSLKIDWDFFQKQGLGTMIQFGLLLSLTGMASLGLKTLDSVLLGKFKALNFVGIYTIVAFIPTIIETPLTALERITAAKMAHAYSEARIDELKNVFYKSVKYLSVIGGLLFIGVNTNIEFLLHFIGKDYSDASAVVYIISVGSLITMFGGSSNPLLVYTSKPWQGALMLILLVIVTFLCNFLLIPRLGINGAALSTAISALLFTGAKFYINYHRFGFQPYDGNSLKVIFIVALCAVINYFLPVLSSDFINILIRSVLLGGLYIGLVYYFQILPELNRFVPWHR